MRVIIAIDVVSGPPFQPSDNRTKQFTDTGGQGHRQRAPECHSGGAAQNVCTSCSRPDCTQKRESPKTQQTRWGQAHRQAI